jgi:MFS family permease
VSQIPPTPLEYASAKAGPWYAGVKPYHWLVLAIASAGWIFDIYEGQIFNITRGTMLGEVLHLASNAPRVKEYGDVLVGVYLVGGALGGVLFGAIGDRWGRGPTMMVTIFMYAIFSGLTYFAHSLAMIATLRFLVAVGTGGEWAVAAALVAEVFPNSARAHASGIFQASSVLGTWAASEVGIIFGSNWRAVYLVGIAPAVLVLAVRAFVREPEDWKRAHRQGSTETNKTGSIVALFSEPIYRNRAIQGFLLAAAGLAGFWAVFVATQDLAQDFFVRHNIGDAAAKAKFAYGTVATAGGGIGLLAMGPICTRIGRRPAFILMQAGALLLTPITWYLPHDYHQLLAILPILGFFTLGMHAGYAIYFPELFPTRFRATGAGLCFNGGRLLAALMMVVSGSLKGRMDYRQAVMLMSLVYVGGIVLIWFMPETAGKPLEI